ncbi:hypothetical protein J7L13_02220, partial [bacterium]|nr:hypothetical protein [bacterium]
SQPGQFATTSKVKIKAKNRVLEVRVVGPFRKFTQVEVAPSDLYHLKITAPQKICAQNDGAKIEIIGPKGKIIRRALILHQRHIHLTEEDLKKLREELKANLRNGDVVQLKIEGKRGGVFSNVVLRVSERAVFRAHIDVDEANALGVKLGATAEIIL